ncbi:MAG: AzlD domain-containing protein [Nitrospinota bacterium]
MVTQPVFFLILGMGVVTYVSRGPILAAAGRLRLPEFVRCCLEVVPAAALGALTVSFLLYPNGEFAGVAQNPYVYAALVALASTLFVRNPLGVVAIGVAALHVIRWRLG